MTRTKAGWLLSSLSLLLLISTSALVLVPRNARARAAWQSKVDGPVLSQIENSGSAEFIVLMDLQADLSGASAFKTKAEKGAYVHRVLTAAAQSQTALLADLDRSGVAYQSFWITNMIWVRGDADVLQSLAERADVTHIYENPYLTLDRSELPSVTELARVAAVEWNISQVLAPDVWAEGVTGEGIVVGGADTGYDWDHPALIDQYRGWNGVTAGHNYHWHDAIHSGGGSCGADTTAPCEDLSHGSHTMGTMVGNDGGSNQIGVAPGARWIGCRNMNVGDGSPATYSECFQWFLAPTDLAGENPRPDLAPHVINNSWSCPISEGCIDPDVLKMAVENLRAASIMVVTSAGNSGSACSTVSAPIAIYEGAFTVGATSSGDQIASFSSRGPVTFDGSGRMKPDISAPGESIRSSVNGGGYSAFSGTSMASPHVAGMAALLMQAAPELIGDVDALEAIIESTALARTTSNGCGGDGPNDVPNNTYGWGRIDALAAYNVAVLNQTLAISKTAHAAQVGPGDRITCTLTISHETRGGISNQLIISDALPADTSFVSATLPYTFTGSTIVWAHPALDEGQTTSRQLVVEVSPQAVAPIDNLQYQVSAANHDAVPGPPQRTLLDVDFSFAWSSAQDVVAEPGSMITLWHLLTNTGNVSNTYQLSLTQTVDWSYLLAPQVSADADEAISVALMVTVPVDAP